MLLTGPGFLKDFSKVKTILANEVIIAGLPRVSNKYLAGPIGPANDPLQHKGSLAGPFEPAIITTLAKIVLTLLKSLENPHPDVLFSCNFI